MFTLDNTDGYTQEQLDAINEEFGTRYNTGEWDWLGDKKEAEKEFADEISKR